MSIEVLVPNLPESVSDATLVAWHKQPGDVVKKDETLVDLETDKVVLEVPAVADGVLKRILRENGTTVISGDVLAILDTDAETLKTEPSVEQELSEEGIEAEDSLPLSPAVRRLIAEHHLDPTTIEGSGKGGRLTKSDVLNYLKENPASEEDQEEEEAPPLAAAPASRASVPTVVEAEEIMKPGPEKARPEQRVRMTRLRARIAERLLQAQQNTATLTTFNEVNLQSVFDLRNQYKARFEKTHAIKLGLMSFFVKASIEALKRFPIVNASIDDQDIIYHGYYDIGIAVSTDRGLIVPVLRDADQLDFAGIEKNIADFGRRAREGSLSLEDLSGGTFTITNGGIFGSLMSTPLLNPPQSAILGMHTIRERPVVENGQVVIRPIMYLALSYDHRIVDGRDAVQFLVTVKECLEAPAHLLLNI
ncbi:MAG: 2-oxoglutarate dehydrogenase complex dihydrolipoyllysine-residue succinyltransferase [Pseudomonadota bacterium]